MRQGQQFQVTYISGQWTYWTNTIQPFGPAGESYICRSSVCTEPLPSSPKGALIGKIGNDVFFVGRSGNFTANASSPLYLRINDADAGLGDNSGSVVMRVTR